MTNAAAGQRSRALVVFWFQGMVVGLVMAGLDMAELFFVVRPAWLRQSDAVSVILLSFLVFAQFGGLVGLCAGFLEESIHRRLAASRFVHRRKDGWTKADSASLSGALVLGGMVALAGVMFYLEFGSGRLMRPGPLLSCGLVGILAAAVLSAVALFTGRVAKGLVFATLWLLLYLVTDRFIAPFSRMGPVAFLHWGMIVSLVVLGQAGITSLSIGSSRTHLKGGEADEDNAQVSSHASRLPVLPAGMHRRFHVLWGNVFVRRSSAFLILLVSWGATALLLRGENNETRLLLYDRTALVFRPASLMEQTTFLGRPPGRNLHRLLARCRARSGDAEGEASNGLVREEQQGRRDRVGCRCGDQPVVRSSDSDFGKWPVRGVVFVMVDALRADMLSTRRAGRSLTPNLLALADQSLFFDRAHSVVPATNAAVGGMLTGRYSLVYDEKFLAKWSVLRVLKRAGIWTGAIVSHRHSRYLFDGLDMVDLSLDVVSLPQGANALTSAEVTSRALHVLRSLSRNQRFFLFVHYYDPHEHYVRNPMFRFGWSDRDLYEGEVAYTDFWIGRLLSGLREDMRLADVAVIVVGDHGDELWEHRYLRHRVHLYEEVTRVPMILHLPGQVRRLHVSAALSTLSAAATLLQLFGLSVQDRQVPSLMVLAGMTSPFVQPGQQRNVPNRSQDVFMLSADRKRWGLLSGLRKVIYNDRTGVVESYDLESDRKERRNLADRADWHTCRLLHRLLSWRRRMLSGK